jgi:hypothetical protein
VGKSDENDLIWNCKCIEEKEFSWSITNHEWKEAVEAKYSQS